MANKKISALTDGVTADATDEIPIARAGDNYYVTPGYVDTYIKGSTAPFTAAQAMQATGDAKTLTVRASAGISAENILEIQTATSDRLAGFDKDGMLLLGRGSAQVGALTLYNASNGNTTKIQSGVATGNLTFTLPVNDGDSGQFLKTDGSGVLSWDTVSTGLTIGTTAITSGTATRLLFEGSGNVVSESANLTWNDTTKLLTATGLGTGGGANSGGLTISGGTFSLSGDISANAWTTAGIRHKSVAGILTDLTSSGPVTAAYTNVYGGNTIAASNSTTFTDYATTYINVPTAGTNVTFTNAWALRLGGGLFLGTGARLTSAAAATLQLGAADVATGAVAQTLQVQSNTGAATTGPDFTIAGSTGTTAGGKIIFQTAATTTRAAALTLAADKTATFAGTVLMSDLRISALSNFSSFVGASGFFTTGQISMSGAAADITASADVRLYRDAANTLALRNGAATPQTFRVYSTYTDGTTNAFGVIEAGVTANTLVIGSRKTGAPSALTKLSIEVDGTSKADYNITNAGAWTLSGGTLNVPNGDIKWGPFGTLIYGLNNNSGSLNLAVNGGTYTFIGSSTAQGLAFGGQTSAYPMLQRSSATLQVRLGDNSGDARMTAGGLAINASPTVTISNGSPGVVTLATHGLHTGQPLVFSTTGALPTGLTAGTTYYAIVTPGTTGTFNVATSLANALAGTAVNTSSAGSGTHTATITSRDNIGTVGSQITTNWGGLTGAITAITAAYNVLVSDYIIEATGASGVPTFPTAVGALGQMYIFKNSSGGAITPATTSSQTIDGSAPASLADKGVLRIYSDGANWKTW